MQTMEKRRRSYETNRGISITCIVMLVIILIACVFMLIYILFSKSEKEKEINNVNNEIQTLTFEGSEILDKQADVQAVLDIVSDPTVFLDTQINNYKRNLPTFENKIKSYELDKKIAYLALVVDKTDNIENVLNTLNSNDILATFFTNSIEVADTISETGHLIGFYLDDEKTVDMFRDEYKDLFDKYNPDLYMLSSNLKEKEISLESLYKVEENSTSEGKKFMTQEAYVNDIVDTTADRDFLIIRVNLSNNIGVNSLNKIITKLKDKNYLFLPLISSSSLFEK